MEFILHKVWQAHTRDAMQPTCECGGLFELDFTPEAWDPELIDDKEWSQFRYRRFMALEGDAWRDVTLGEGRTPIVRFDDDVLFKMDYMMPTLSFKRSRCRDACGAHEGDRCEVLCAGLERQRGQCCRSLCGASGHQMRNFRSRRNESLENPHD